MGSTLTFGRSGQADIVVQRQVEDLLVSRRAGRLTAVAGGLLVTNDSRRNTVYLQGVPGPEFDIRPLMTVGTMPFRRCRLVLLGSHTARYVLDISCESQHSGSLDPVDESEASLPGVPAAVGFRRLDISDAQRRYLAALCEPILTCSGVRAPATYRDIAQRCGVAPKTIRNSLDALRQKLSMEDGIPGLIHLGASAGNVPGTVNFLSALAAWAVHSGNVTTRDLEALDR
jgi:hypothetical protein